MQPLPSLWPGPQSRLFHTCMEEGVQFYTISGLVVTAGQSHHSCIASVDLTATMNIFSKAVFILVIRRMQDTVR